jgi:hypothetical protein
MELIKFEDSCVITRATGTKDEWDNEIFETIYSGVCNYQEGGQTSLSVVTRNDILYLPQNDVLIKRNDVVTATKGNKGRVIKGVVNTTPRDIRMPLSGDELTKVEIKQAKGD